MLRWFPPAGTLSAVTPSVWESPSRLALTTAWRDTSATCWATAAPGWRSESRACMRTWPATPTGRYVWKRTNWIARMQVFYLNPFVHLCFFQRPHGASRLRVFPPGKGRRLQSGRSHDAGPAQRGHGEGCRAVHCKFWLICLNVDDF